VVFSPARDRGDELIAQRSREGELRDWQIVGGHGE